MWLTALYPAWALPATPGQALIAAVIAGGGLLVMVWAALCFRRARTTVNPMDPGQVSALVEVGPYRYSRNPMYLGDTLLLIAWAVYLGTPVNAVWVVLFTWWMHRFQIPHEERALADSFGAAWHGYRSRVRRWL
ncbi:MAG: isoprenylcysteine carboxylmethyltransferase family protein [Halofilum sp. (in: g-proteobacteria)]|nr:isoprenylcysteine carboxylmethyltransferase family protein [Halofilum sp. (in: g-proteobacteria)]